MDQRKQQERHFHDHLREEAPHQRWSREAERNLRGHKQWSNLRFYSIEHRSRQFVEGWLRDRCRDKRFLDYGCGNGEDVVLAAKHGADAVGIDVSPISLTHGRELATKEGVSSKTSFLPMDAENLGFRDASFDIINIYGVLHHLDFPQAMSELARVLKPEGEIICTEALGHNPIIRRYRKRTPHLRTEWEAQHILRREEVKEAATWFNSVQWQTYHLATLAAVPFRNIPAFNWILRPLELVDAGLLRIPLIRWHAWHIVLRLAQPKKLSLLQAGRAAEEALPVDRI